MRILALLALFISLGLGNCNEKFSINGSIKASEVIDKISNVCMLNVIFLDNEAKKILDSSTPTLNTKNLKINKLLEIVLNGIDLHFILEDQILKIGYLITKTYEINYVSTSRVGSSSTDVVFSQSTKDNEGQQNSYEQQGDTYNKAINIGTNQNSLNFGKSGTKIFSIDEMNFWGELESQIYNIAYRKPNKDKSTNIIINKGAGLLTITASLSQIKRIDRYISTLNKKMHSQVLIDVEILTIKHNNTNTYGINWNELYNLGNVTTGSPSTPSVVNINNSGVNYEINIFSQNVSLNRIVEFLKSYGSVQSLSNPKVLTLNNQPAIISVGSVLRYLQSTVYQSNSQGSSIQNQSQQYPSVFAGVLLDVTPSIQGNEIILKINPSITRTKNSSIENEINALNSPPNLSTNQLSSLVKVKDGEKIILGGLISTLVYKKEYKVPILGDIPILNYLFKYTSENDYLEEMVIIISPKIIYSPLSPKKAGYTKIK